MRQNKDGERKLLKRFGLFSLAICATLYGESFADFKQVQAESFSKFSDQKDSEFSKYIKQQWKEYQAYTSPKMYTKPKPTEIIPANKKPLPHVGPIVKIGAPKKVTPKKVVPLMVKKDTSFEFFGVEVGFNVAATLKQAKFYPTNQAGIVNFFSVMASHDYMSVIEDIKKTQTLLQLNDWAVYLLVQKLSKKIFYNGDDAKLFVWFLLNKMGYDVKVGLSQKHIVLLHATQQSLYATPYYTLHNKKYYLLEQMYHSNVGRVFTYEHDYPEATKSLDFRLEHYPLFGKKIIKKQRSFYDHNKKYIISYTLNKNIIDFMATYPQVAYSVYFNTHLSQVTYDGIAQSLKGYLDGKKASEAINFVLRFVQKGFVYETDNAQFGHEKVMFAEETLFYDKSDCEDRAILFARLVKKLFGLRVVGVKYSNHMATALYIPMRGDSVRVGSMKYVVADPTYINANIGQSMPQYRSIIPQKFIFLTQR